MGEPGHAYARRVARSAEHLGGRRRSAVGGRRSAGGGRRAASRLFADSVSPQVVGHRAACCHFQFKLKTLPNLAPPGEIRGYKLKGILKYISQNKLKGILKYISQNKVDASRRAEKCRSLRVQVEDGVSGCA